MNKKLIALLFAGVFMAALDIAIVGPALPAIRSAFSVSDRLLPWLVNIYVLTNLAATPLLGKLSDVYGRKPVYLWAISLFLIGSVIVIIAPSLPWVIIGRGIQGLGAGGIFPIAAATIGDVVAREKQGRVLGITGAMFGLAFTLGPIVGGLLLKMNDLIGNSMGSYIGTMTWQWIFIINIPISLAVMYGANKLMPTPVRQGNLRFDTVGMIMLIVALTSFAYGINQINTKDVIASVFSLNVLPFILLGVVIIPIFYRMQKRLENPTIKPHLLNTKQLLVTYLIAAGTPLCEISIMYLPLLAKMFYNVDNAHASFMIIPLAVALIFGAPMAGRLLDKVGSRMIIFSGTILCMSGLLLFGLVPHIKAWFYVADVLLGIGMAFLLGTPLRYIINSETKPDERASGQSLMTIFNSTGKLIAAAFAGALIDSLGSNEDAFRTTFIVFTALAGILLVLTFFLKTKKQEQKAA